MQNNALNYVISCALFAGIAFALCVNFEMMLVDSDTAWHLASGDLIRRTGAIPTTDPWAFTSAGVPWINLAWLWDVIISALHAKLGWHGILAFNSVVIALTVTLLYNACLLRSGQGIASFFSVLLVIFSLPVHTRSMQITNLFLAGLFLLALLIEYRRWNVRWWYVMPALMPLWVNMHGGFIIAFLLLGAFGLQAFLRSQWRMAFHMAAAGLLSIAALGISPYGYQGVFDVVVLTFTTPALGFISEFQPTTLSWGFLLSFLYVPVFLFCAIHRRAQTSLAEGLLGFGLLLFAATSRRYWTFVYIFSAPILAQYFTSYIKEGTRAANPVAARIAQKLKTIFFINHAKATCLAASLATALGIAALFSPASAVPLKHDLDPYSIFRPAIQFARTHYPGYHFLNDYLLGGIFIAAAPESIPVFIDGRGETAYPRKLVADFGDMLEAKPNWEQLLDTYHIDGAILVNYQTLSLLPRFEERKGWTRVFKDEFVSIYIRDARPGAQPR